MNGRTSSFAPMISLVLGVSACTMVNKNCEYRDSIIPSFNCTANLVPNSVIYDAVDNHKMYIKVKQDDADGEIRDCFFNIAVEGNLNICDAPLRAISGKCFSDHDEDHCEVSLNLAATMRNYNIRNRSYGILALKKLDNGHDLLYSRIVSTTNDASNARLCFAGIAVNQLDSAYNPSNMTDNPADILRVCNVVSDNLDRLCMEKKEADICFDGFMLRSLANQVFGQKMANTPSSDQISKDFADHNTRKMKRYIELFVGGNNINGVNGIVYWSVKAHVERKDSEDLLDYIDRVVTTKPTKGR
jgi:thiol-disulfide isomerase/thioredoxin